jgi:hypothetical protein
MACGDRVDHCDLEILPITKQSSLGHDLYDWHKYGGDSAHVWGLCEYHLACDTFDQHVRDPLFHRQVIRRQRILYVLLMLLLGSSLFFIDQNLRRMPNLIITAFLMMFIVLIVEIRGYHQKSIEIMRSFVPRQQWSLTLKQLHLLTTSGAVIALLSLGVIALGYTSLESPWAWILVSASSLILGLVPYQIAYRQLAQEFDKLWP